MALENSHILLLNAGPGVVGLETLKNLVLPGIGNFTIQDSAVVSEDDLGVNFFLEEEHLGAFRAEHTCNLLKELNPDVQGNYITEVRLTSVDTVTSLIIRSP
jgi:amyloid beta precursor protein binding protein 1